MSFLKYAAATCLLGLSALAAPAAATTYKIEPGPNAWGEIQGAMNVANQGDLIRLEAGRYELPLGLTMTGDAVELRGRGSDKTVLSFAGQTRPGPGLLTTGRQVKLRDFAVEDAKGNGIEARGGGELTFLNLRIDFTRGLNPQNGAAGLFVTNAQDVMIDGVLARGASHAGIRVSQSQAVLIKNSSAEQNVIGIAIENTNNADVTEANLAHNAIGFAALDLPGLKQVGGRSIRFMRSKSLANDQPNKARPDDPISAFPGGVGVLVSGSRDVHILNNDIGDSAGVNILLIAFGGEVRDPAFDPLPRDIAIRGNRFGRHGFSPMGQLADLRGVLPDILWDGATSYIAAGRPRTEPVLMAVENNTGFKGAAVNFVSLGLMSAGSPWSEGQPTGKRPLVANLVEPPPVQVTR